MTLMWQGNKLSGKDIKEVINNLVMQDIVQHLEVEEMENFLKEVCDWQEGQMDGLICRERRMIGDAGEKLEKPVWEKCKKLLEEGSENSTDYAKRLAQFITIDLRNEMNRKYM